MAVHELNLKALMEELDNGRVHEAFMTELRRCVADCEDRPADDKTRKITVSFLMSPLVDDLGHLESVNGKFLVESSVPKRRSKIYNFAVRNGRKLVFNDLSETDANQRTLDMD